MNLLNLCNKIDIPTLAVVQKAPSGAKNMNMIIIMIVVVIIILVIATIFGNKK